MAYSPQINFPTSLPGFSTNLASQTIRGSADPTTSSILVNGSTNGVTYTSGATSWLFTTMLQEGDNIFNVVAKDGAGLVSLPDTITATYITDTDLNLIVSAPTGIVLERSKNKVKISVAQNPETEVIGYNFYGSEFVAGGTVGFTLLNTTLVTAYDYFKENSIVLSNTVDTSGGIRSTYTIEKIENDYYYSYTHDRVNNAIGTKPLSEANHYVVTAVAFDPILQIQVESSYSSELSAAPLLIDTAIKDLPLRTTLDVQTSAIDSILIADSKIDVKPGTITRDIQINPPSDEFERLYIIQDFQHRSQSFLTLIPFDDANDDGISDDVLTSPPKLRLKEALLLPDARATDVQVLIDAQFTKLAGNVNKKRKEAQKAAGSALFYTRRTPTRDASIYSGGIVATVSDATTASVQFSVLTDFVLTVADLPNYYNSATNRYEVTLDIQAINAGSLGNVDAGSITLPIAGVDSIFGVTNPNPTEFGQNIESNSSLAERAMLAFDSVDSGTKYGYLATTLGTTNVQRAKIVSAGETLMQRDMDPLRLIHTFGKVDIYVQGSLQTQYTETFGFTYATVKNEKVTIQNPTYFQFSLNNSNVDIEHPLYSILEVKNITKAANYDTTGFTLIGDYNGFELDPTLPTNATIGLAALDVVYVSYRYRDSDPYLFKNQPVESIVSISGPDSGSLTAANYTLLKLEDLLAFGGSTSAHDMVQLKYANSVPLGGMMTIVDESHILVGTNTYTLNYYGVDTDTILVTDSTNTITYEKGSTKDYVVVAGGISDKTTIQRTATSTIPSGSLVLVDYLAGENFTVTYTVNTILTSVQNKIDIMRHLTADVVTKEAVKTYIDFDMTILLLENSDQTSVDRKIRTAIASLMTKKDIGVSIYQSDIINAIENTSGVDYVVVPFFKMVKANNSQVIRENFVSDWVKYPDSTSPVYRSSSTLSWPTSENGGSNLFVGVFENDIELGLFTSVNEVLAGPGRAYIAAEDQGPGMPKLGRLYVYPKLGNINEARINVTYLVSDAAGARDIDFSGIEYGAVGTLTITYDYSTQS